MVNENNPSPASPHFSEDVVPIRTIPEIKRNQEFSSFVFSTKVDQPPFSESIKISQNPFEEKKQRSFLKCPTDT